MKIDVTQVIQQLDGTPMLVDQEPERNSAGQVIGLKEGTGQPATFARTAVDALLATFKGEEELAGSKKLERFKLAEKLHGAMLPVELSEPEAELIKSLACRAYGTLVYARIDQIITEAKALANAARKQQPFREAAE